MALWFDFISGTDILTGPSAFGKSNLVWTSRSFTVIALEQVNSCVRNITVSKEKLQNIKLTLKSFQSYPADIKTMV